MGIKLDLSQYVFFLELYEGKTTGKKLKNRFYLRYFRLIAENHLKVKCMAQIR